MTKFSLHDILNDQSLSEAGATRKVEDEKDMIVDLDIYDLIPSDKNFYDVSQITDLIETIPVVGLLQPILVKPSDKLPGKYDIIAGHRRRKACAYLVEKGMEKYKMVPCIIKEGDESREDSDIINQLTLILSNRYRDITDFEKMNEVIELERILTVAKARDSVRGVLESALADFKNDDKKVKSRDIIAAFSGTSSTQVGRYKAIHKNLCDNLMAAFRDNQINVSVAYEASGLSKIYQEKAYAIYQNGGLTLSQVQGLKQVEKDKTPIKGQQSLDVSVQEEKVPVAVPPVQSAPKTQEQIYDEEQKKIDRETKAKLDEMREEEKYEAHQQAEKNNNAPKEYDLDFSVKEFSNIYYGTRSFLILVDKGYKADDVIIMKRMIKGERDGHEIKCKVKEVINDCTGIEDKYCILVLQVLYKSAGE